MEKTILKFPKNDSVAYFLTINKIEKELDSAYMTVKENPDDTEPLIKKSLGAGISLVDNRLYKNQLSYKIQLDGADTQFMEVGVRYFFDIKGTIGNAQKTFRAGELILSETETGYLNPATTGETTMIAQVFETDFATGNQSEYVETEVDPVATAKIGDMTKLDTTEKGTIVKAINEVKKAVDDAETPLFTEATARENIESGEKQPTLWGKVKKWFSSLKALAFKDKVGTSDFEADAKCPNATNAVNAEKTSFSNENWQTFDDSVHTVEPNAFYFVEFSYSGHRYQTLIYTRKPTSKLNTKTLTTLSDGTDYITLNTYWRSNDTIDLDGTINGDHGFWDNVTEIQYVKIK